MQDNTELLQQLLLINEIELENAQFLREQPRPLPEGWDFARVEGMLLGLAIGDSLGNTSEAQLPHRRRKTHGEIRDYLPNRYAGMQKVGVPSDDTQMAFWTLEQLLEDGGLVPGHLAERFTRQHIYGIGTTVRDFIFDYKNHGGDWLHAGQPSAGNGAIMRIAPLLIPHLRSPSPVLWADAALAGMITHNDRAANACSVAFVHVLWECLCLQDTPDPVWWVDTFVEAARQLEGDTQHSPRHDNIQYTGPLWQFVDQQVRQAIRAGETVLQAGSRWFSGAYLLETMPAVLFILAKHAHEPEEAILRAVNDTKDNDTIAAIVGAAVGALHGRANLPARWVEGLSGRTGAEDDWHLFELIESARQTFWQADPPLNREDIRAVLAFMPVFEQPGFTPGKWDSMEGSLPWFTYNEQVLRFITTLGKGGFLQPFPWPDWREAKQLIDRPELLHRASLQTLRKLLTLHVRADRFNEGHLAHQFETRQMLAILKRLEEIVEA